MSLLDPNFDIIAEKDAEIAKLKQEVEVLKLLNDINKVDKMESSQTSIYKKLAEISTVLTGNDGVAYGFDLNETTASYYYIDQLYTRVHYWLTYDPKRCALIRNLINYRGWRDFLKILLTKQK